MLMVTYQTEVDYQELWENPTPCPGAKRREGARGQLITINPPDLPNVRVQVFPGGKITIYASNVLALGRAIAFLQEHLRIFRTEKAQTQPICIRQVGSRPVSDSGPRFQGPELNIVEEWTYDKNSPRGFARKYTLRWKTVKVGAKS